MKNGFSHEEIIKDMDIHESKIYKLYQQYMKEKL